MPRPLGSQSIKDSNRAVATATPVSRPSVSASPILALHRWHLLSLDAPTVATLWTWFIARTIHLHLPPVALLSMFLAVWMLYAADRLLDATTSSPAELEARHHFHHRHRTAFLAGILLASIALAALLPRLEPASIHLYLILGGLLAGYFILIHATGTPASPRKAAQRLPKEIAVGIFFAAATFIPTVARHPELRLTLLAPALLFAVLCSLNCLYIYAWEHPSPHPGHPAHATTRLALRHLVPLTFAIPIVTLALLSLTKMQWPIPAACALSAILLLLLHNQRRNLAPITLRAAADLALTTPLLILPFLR
jgi:hypothetical protein